MALIQNQKFEDEDITLDGNEYVGCDIIKCRVKITRGNWSMKGCRFQFNRLDLEGEALELWKFFQAMSGGQAKGPKMTPPIGR